MYGKNRRTYVLISLFAVQMFTLAAASTAATVFKSRNPRFARVAITLNDSKYMLLAFDESQGTGKGYDTLYADTNFDGKLSDSERHYTPLRGGTKQILLNSRQSLLLAYPFKQGLGMPGNRLDVSWTRIPGKSASQADRFYLSRAIQWKRGTAMSTLIMYSAVQPSGSRTNPPRISFTRSKSIRVMTLPDRLKPGNTGFALFVVFGDWQAQAIPHFTALMPATLVVKSMDGKVVCKGSGDFSNFGLG